MAVSSKPTNRGHFIVGENRRYQPGSKMDQ
jgi:hypothetical protein